jgi:hypothetical protein
LPDDRPTSRRTAVVVGSAVALAGAFIVAVSIFGGAEKFEAPRWVVGACGGAFLVFGGWTAAVYGRGYDPSRSPETLPSPWIQLAVLVPGLLVFAAPFHWIAFGPGPRHFSTSVSIPFLSTRTGSGETVGRILFGVGAVLIDAIIIVSVIRLVREGRRGSSG